VINFFESGLGEDSVKLIFANTSSRAFLSRSARILDRFGNPTKSVDIHEPFTVEMKYEIKKNIDGVIVPNYQFHTATGVCGFVANAPNLKEMMPGFYNARCVIPGNIMNEGTYSIGVAATTYIGSKYQVNYYERGLLTITIRDPKIPDAYNYGYCQTVPGILRPRLMWELTKDNS